MADVPYALSTEGKSTSDECDDKGKEKEGSEIKKTTSVRLSHEKLNWFETLMEDAVPLAVSCQEASIEKISPECFQGEVRLFFLIPRALTHS